MPSGVCGTPSYTPRTRDIEAHQTWLKEQTTKELGDPKSRAYWDAAHAAYEREKREYEESERRRIEEGNRRYQAAVDAERRQQEQRVFGLMLATVFEDATAEENTRVTRLIEQKHGKNCRDLNIWEMTLRALRETLQGNTVGPDWRSGLREVSRRKDA